MALIPLKKKNPTASSGAPSVMSGDKPTLKAVKIRMEMNDGTIFTAEGDHANAIWNYQMECEQLANASGVMPSYLGPAMVRSKK